MKRNGVLVLALLLVIGVLPLGLSGQAAAQTRPSFVVIVTDDMRAADWEALPKTRALLEEHGTRFENFFVTTSLCCPSRASILTGQYTHNHGVTSSWKQFVRNGLNDDTVALALDRAGYRTALVGKYLNGFPAKGHVPPGWDRFEAYENNGDYYGLVVNQNGRTQHYGKKRYEADVLSTQAQDFLRGLGADEPFLLYLGPKAPHAPFEAPKRHRSAFDSVIVERTPDFNEADVSDKPLHIRELRPVHAGAYDGLNRKRLRTLLVVDETIAEIWDALEQSGRLETTYLFVLSDNGFTIGHHRRVGKTAPYDKSVRVPMYAAGPGFAAGAIDERLAATIDVAPTIAAAAGIDLPNADGFSLLEPTMRDALLLEWRFVPTFEEDGLTAEARKGKGRRKGNQRRDGDSRWTTGPVPDYLGLRTPDELYVVYRTGERELYDYATDPYELDNLLADWLGHQPSASALAREAVLAERMEQLHDCAGASCRPAS